MLFTTVETLAILKEETLQYKMMREREQFVVNHVEQVATFDETTYNVTFKPLETLVGSLYSNYKEKAKLIMKE